MKKRWFITILLIVGSSISVSFANYSTEEKQAYDYVYKNNITTMDSIDEANLGGNLTRIAMAKMFSNYAINILGLTPDTNKNCYFSDVSSNLDYQYDNGVTKACQLSLMGVGISQFYPYGKVTRAEFGTVLSRALNARDTIKLSKMNSANPYYYEHLRFLNEQGIMNNISYPSNFELRGRVMIMLMRSDTSAMLENCDPEEFDRILTACNINNRCKSDGKSLSCQRIREIKPGAFVNYEDIEKLHIMGCAASTDCSLNSLSEIGKLKNLKVLEVPFNNFNDISPLANLVNLEELDIESNYVSDVSPLSNLVNLKKLTLSNNFISDISPLKNLTKLEELEIHNDINQPKITDISALKDMNNLKVLNLNSNEITDISPLSGKNLLITLYLGRNKIKDISVLRDCINLEELSLASNQISDISPLKNLVNLRLLGLNVNQITDISPLKDITKLVNLALNTNKISDVSPLSGMSYLQYLYLGENNITDISPLENLKRLNELFIGKNSINYEDYPRLYSIKSVSMEY